MNAGEGSLNLDFAEFDSEGLSALEKIYLFSRSRAGFQRVFIAHALPGYLRHRREGHPNRVEQGDDSPEADEITPAEAVEYVLPLLNGLAMDEGMEFSCWINVCKFSLGLSSSLRLPGQTSDLTCEPPIMRVLGRRIMSLHWVLFPRPSIDADWSIKLSNVRWDIATH